MKAWLELCLLASPSWKGWSTWWQQGPLESKWHPLDYLSFPILHSSASPGMAGGKAAYGCITDSWNCIRHHGWRWQRCSFPNCLDWARSREIQDEIEGHAWTHLHLEWESWCHALCPSVSNCVGRLRDLSESDDCLEGWEFQGQAEQCEHMVRLSEDNAEVWMVDTDSFEIWLSTYLWC